MDIKVSNAREDMPVEPVDDFLLREGLEVLATYRAIRSDVFRQAVRELVASLATADGDASVN